MTAAWHSDERYPHHARIGLAGAGRAILRGVPMVVLVFGGLGVLLLVRLAERPLHGQHRPWTPHVTRLVCRGALRILGLRLEVSGERSDGHGAIVANHASWLDIFVLNAASCIYFVSKSEVAAWAGIGWLARATGTVFIERDPRQALSHRDLLRRRLELGHRLLFFPEGTSTDGRRVLPFKPTLFEALIATGAEGFAVQPVTVCYRAPKGADPRLYAWWGDMAFGPHFLHVLAMRRPGRVSLIWHDVLTVADFPDRKALARACETAVRRGLETGQ